MNNIQILKEARKLIESRDEYYICSAITTVTGKKISGKPHPLETWISSMLDGYSKTLFTWLRCHHPELGDIDRHSEKMRDTRLAWIDSMIDYLEKGGKIK